jgi:hypothetical protein
MTFKAVATGSHAHGLPVYNLVANETGRCVGLRDYIAGRTVPVLLGCETADTTQQWVVPTNSTRIGSILSVSAMTNGDAATALAVSNSTLFGTQHSKDSQPLLDVTYGEMWLELQPYLPEPPCFDRNCQDYNPTQSWYWSPRSGTVVRLQDAHRHAIYATMYGLWSDRCVWFQRLAAANGGGYHCDEPGCYQLTSHLPTYEEFCLARVASISAYGVDPSSDHTGGTDVYAGPLSGGAYVFGLLNRNSKGGANATIEAKFSWLEVPGLSDSTTACVRELFSDRIVTTKATGSVSVSVAPHDLAVLRVVPGASTC